MPILHLFFIGNGRYPKSCLGLSFRLKVRQFAEGFIHNPKFPSQFTNWPNKLECLFLACFRAYSTVLGMARRIPLSGTYESFFTQVRREKKKDIGGGERKEIKKEEKEIHMEEKEKRKEKTRWSDRHKKRSQ